MDWTITHLIPTFLGSERGRRQDEPCEPPRPARDDDKEKGDHWDDEKEDRDETSDDLEEADLPGTGGTHDR
jgi:hypothetical protein